MLNHDFDKLKLREFGWIREFSLIKTPINISTYTVLVDHIWSTLNVCVTSDLDRFHLKSKQSAVFSGISIQGA